MRLLKSLLCLSACLMLASCASLLGPRDVELPLWKLQRSLDQRFPIDSRVLEVFDVRLSNPHLQLMPQDQRVGLSLDTSITPPFMQRVWVGTMAMSGRLGLDSARNQLLLREGRVDRFDIDGLDPEAQRQVARIASIVLTRIVREVPIYTFRPEDLRFAGVQFVPTNIRVREQALVVTLEPVR